MAIKKKTIMITTVAILILLCFATYQDNIMTRASRWNMLKSHISSPRILTTKTSCLDNIRRGTQTCLFEKLRNNESFWLAINPAITECTMLLQKTVGYLKLENPGDYKFIILPHGYYNSSQNCTLLTIGIGEDIVAEEKVKGYFPNCRFIGTDPIYESGIIYETLGEFLNVAVSDKNGSITASVLENGWYDDKTVRSIDFRQLLRQINEPMIDFLFLDAEGAEYAIFPLLLKDVIKPYSICQISVEIHGFDSTYHMTEAEFKTQLLSLLLNSTYVPLFGEYAVDNEFDRMFWVDFESEDCVRKYFPDFCHFVN